VAKIFYFEYIHPIRDYFLTLRANEGLFDWGAPFLISLGIYLYPLNLMDFDTIKTINGYAINLLAILVGFSITSLTILTANTSKNIEDLRDNYTKRSLRGKPVSLYQLIILNFIFLLVMEFVSLLYSFGFLLLIKVGNLMDSYKEAFLLSIYLITHVVFLNIRNVTNFYFIVSRDE
jgi:hypothetical protein